MAQRLAIPILILLLGAGLLYLSFRAERPTYTAGDFTTVQGQLTMEGDSKKSIYRTFVLKGMEGRPFYLRDLYLDEEGELAFAMEMKAGAAVAVEVLRSEWAGEGAVHVYGLKVGEKVILGLEKYLATQGQYAEGERNVYLWIGVVLGLGGLLLGYARWVGKKKGTNNRSAYL